MRRLAILSVVMLALAAPAHAGKRLESCESATLDPDKGWIYTPVPCKPDSFEAGKEKACGKDYGELRVGMSIKRVEQCLEALSLETETVTAGGVITHYSSTFYLISARNGKVTSYTRRTH